MKARNGWFSRYFARAAIVCATLIVGLSAGRVCAQNIVETDEIVYRNVNGRELMLDVARPSPLGIARPTVVFLCGNAWGYDKSINRQQFWYGLSLTASKGYVAVTVDYSSTIETPYQRPVGAFPAQLNDVKSAIRFLRANARKYDIDPSRIAVVGFSSGATLALMLGLTQPSDGMEGSDAYLQYSSAVRAVVSFSGVTDLASWNRDPYVSAYMGGHPKDMPELYRKASPITYVRPDAPPILTIHGDSDTSVPLDQAVLLDKKLNEAGGSHTLVVKRGYGHDFDLAGDAIWKFLDKSLKQ